MAHKILIEYRTSYPIVRERPLLVELTLTNIGKVSFPGGTMKSIRLELEGYRESVAEKSSVPPLQNEEKFTIAKTFVPRKEGFGWLIVEIDSKDRSNIDFYQNRGNAAIGNEWRNGVFVENPRLIEIEDLLRNVLEECKKRN